MEEILKIRLSTAEKQQLQAKADKEGITLSELVVKSLKLKRTTFVKKRQEQAA